MTISGGKKKYTRGFRKGTRSKTRRGHKNFETYKGSKRYSEKRFKRKFGRLTGRAPFFPFAGGETRKNISEYDAASDMVGGRRYRRSRMRRHLRHRSYRKRNTFKRRRNTKSKGLFSFLFN